MDYPGKALARLARRDMGSPHEAHKPPVPSEQSMQYRQPDGHAMTASIQPNVRSQPPHAASPSVIAAAQPDGDEETQGDGGEQQARCPL